jgi:hypothetical protein
MAKGKQPSSDNPMEREAKDDIDVARDIVSSDKPQPAPAVPTRPPGWDPSAIDPMEGARRLAELHAEVEADALENARERAGRGCLTRMGLAGAGAIAFIAVLVGGIVLLKSNDSGSTTKTAANSSTPAAQAAGDAAADVSSFAGHWELVAGLDDQRDLGFDVPPTGGQTMMGALDPSSASLDIDANGTITGGEYATSIRFTQRGQCDDPKSGSLNVAASSASGNVAASGRGTVVWNATRTSNYEACRDHRTYTGPVPIHREFSIQGDSLVLCDALKPSDNACAGRLVATFRR